MSILQPLFGPSRDEVWGRLIGLIDGRVEARGLIFPEKVVVAHAGPWTVTLDTPRDRYGPAYTRMRAPYINRDGFRFDVYRNGVFGWLG